MYVAGYRLLYLELLLRKSSVVCYASCCWACALVRAVVLFRSKVESDGSRDLSLYSTVQYCT